MEPLFLEIGRGNSSGALSFEQQHQMKKRIGGGEKVSFKTFPSAHRARKSVPGETAATRTIEAVGVYVDQGGSSRGDCQDRKACKAAGRRGPAGSQVCRIGRHFLKFAGIIPVVGQEKAPPRRKGDLGRR